jgi:cytochrome d ubiquinol oxidase subunit I
MDVEFLARLQFAFTIMFHYIYASLSIGLALIITIIEGCFMTTRNPAYDLAARFWTKIFALTFVFGAVTGIVMEFEFGTNWASYSRFVGDLFGSPLAAEGLFSFFLESVFLAILVFAGNRVSKKTHFFSTIMVCLGAHLSAVWIIAANSWMHTPAGFRIVGEGAHRHVEITSFSAMFWNPSMADRLTHVIIGAWLSGAFFVIGVAAYSLLKERFRERAWVSMKIALLVASFSLTLQLISGDTSARSVAKNFPTRLAAYEGIFSSQTEAPLSIFGIINTDTQRVDYQLAIPGLLSVLAYGDSAAKVQGLDTVPQAERPNVPVIFQAYHAMVATWGLMASAVAIAYWYWWRGSFQQKKWVLRILLLAAFLPQIGNQAGWVATEMGRYPWIVHNLLRISEGISKTVSSHQVFGSMLLFMGLYSTLFVMYIALLCRKISGGSTIEPSGATTVSNGY